MVRAVGQTTSDRIRRLLKFTKPSAAIERCLRREKRFGVVNSYDRSFCEIKEAVAKNKYHCSMIFSRHERMFYAADDFESTGIACRIEDSFEYGGNQI